MFISHLIMIFDECRRVLRKTGTLWVNIGDSYSKPNKYNKEDQGRWGNGKNNRALNDIKVDMSAHNIPEKSLCNIPGCFAEGMIAAGWVLPNEIIWYKPSVVPSSVRDRFTVDYEKIFFFTKSPKYHFEQQFEPYAESTPARYNRNYGTDGKNKVYREKYGHPKGLKTLNPNGRNKRCVWRLSTENNKYGHYAAYPMKLVETPVLAGCPPGGIVLDPFAGSGTTAIVARRLGRGYILIEPNPEYAEIIRQRLQTTNENSNETNNE